MVSSVFFGASSEDIWGDSKRRSNADATHPSQRRCSRPTCATLANATLSFDYAKQQAVLTPLISELRPELYDLCAAHADRTSPPRGWSLADDRFTAPSQGRIFSDEAQALSMLIDDMKRTPRPRR